jgi:hypothetical protein
MRSIVRRHRREGSRFAESEWPYTACAIPRRTGSWIGLIDGPPEVGPVQVSPLEVSLDQHHWLGRVKRKSIIVSKFQEMVDLTMALFAKLWVNGNQDDLLSLLD